MQFSIIAVVLLSLISAGKPKHDCSSSNSESISISKRIKSFSKLNRHEPVIIYTKSKPTHNILVGRKHKKQEISNSFSFEECKGGRCPIIKECAHPKKKYQKKKKVFSSDSSDSCHYKKKY